LDQWKQLFSPFYWYSYWGSFIITDNPRQTWAETAARGTTLLLIAWISSAVLSNLLYFFLDELTSQDLDRLALAMKLVGLIPLLFGILEGFGVWKVTVEVPSVEPRWINRLRLTVRILWVTNYFVHLVAYPFRFILETGQPAAFGVVGGGTWSVFVFLSLYYIQHLFRHLREEKCQTQARILLALYPLYAVYQFFVYPRVMRRLVDEPEVVDTIAFHVAHVVAPLIPGIVVIVLLLGIVWKLGRALRRHVHREGSISENG
jgi:hypothetical protein